MLTAVCESHVSGKIESSHNIAVSVCRNAGRDLLLLWYHFCFVRLKKVFFLFRF